MEKKYGEAEEEGITEPTPGILTIGERVWFCGGNEEEPVPNGILKSIVMLEE